jgi:hypothetical protein
LGSSSGPRKPSEAQYQQSLVRRLRGLFPGCIIIKGDPNWVQGIPDLILLIGNTWAAFECKIHAAAEERPNQGYYIENMNEMSFAAFIYPENEDEVLDALQRALGLVR